VKERLRDRLYFLPYTVLGKLSEIVSSYTYRFTNGYSFIPRAVIIYPTERCNLHCDMCFLNYIRKYPDELPFDIVKKIIREVKYYKPAIGLTGGEPMLYRHFKETVELVKKNNLSLSIVTNGSLLKHFAEFLIHSGIDRIKISVDGPPEVHNRLRRVKNSFQLIEEGIKEINRLKKKKGIVYPRMILYSLLSRDNDPEFIIKFAEANHFSSVVFLNILTLNVGDSLLFEKITGQKSHYWRGAEFDNRYYRVKKQDYERIKNTARSIPIYFVPKIEPGSIEKYYNKEPAYLDKFRGRCKTPFSAVTVKPDGSVEICPDYKIGSLKNKDLLKIWNSDKARQLRKFIASGNILPVCKGCCNYYY